MMEERVGKSVRTTFCIVLSGCYWVCTSWLSFKEQWYMVLDRLSRFVDWTLGYKWDFYTVYFNICNTAFMVKFSKTELLEQSGTLILRLIRQPSDNHRTTGGVIKLSPFLRPAQRSVSRKQLRFWLDIVIVKTVGCGGWSRMVTTGDKLNWSCVSHLL